MVNSLNNAQVGTRSLNGLSIQSKGIDRVKALRFEHHCVSSIGGFLGTYSIMNYHDILAAAQTANMIDIVMAILGKDVSSFLVRLGAVVLYLMGFFLTVYIPKFTKVNVQTFALIVDALAVVMMGLIPSGINDVIALYPIFFAMAVQWNSFTKVENYVSSTIFSTNNLKQATTSLMEYFLDTEKDTQKLDKSKFFSGSILGYHLGVALAFCSCKMLGTLGVWLCLVPIAIAMISHIRVLKGNC